jgi:hypothetical protein
VVAKRPIEELINFACSLSKVYRHFNCEFSIAGGVREEGEGGEGEHQAFYGRAGYDTHPTIKFTLCGTGPKASS